MLCESLGMDVEMPGYAVSHRRLLRYIPAVDVPVTAHWLIVDFLVMFLPCLHKENFNPV